MGSVDDDDSAEYNLGRRYGWEQYQAERQFAQTPEQIRAQQQANLAKQQRDADREAYIAQMQAAGVGVPGQEQAYAQQEFAPETVYQPTTPTARQSSQYIRDAWGRIIPLAIGGLSATGDLGNRAPTTASMRNREQELLERSAEQRAEADRAGAIAARDEMVQAGRDVGFAQNAAATAARRQLGVGGAAAAAQAGAEAAFDAGVQAMPGAVQAARDRKDLFEQKEVDRRQMSDNTKATLHDQEQARIGEDETFRNTQNQERQANFAQTGAQASRAAAYRRMLERNKQQEEQPKTGEPGKEAGDNTGQTAQDTNNKAQEETSNATGGGQQTTQTQQPDTKPPPNTDTVKKAANGKPKGTPQQVRAMEEAMRRDIRAPNGAGPTAPIITTAIQKELGQTLWQRLGFVRDDTRPDLSTVNDQLGWEAVQRVYKAVETATSGGGRAKNYTSAAPYAYGVNQSQPGAERWLPQNPKPKQTGNRGGK